MKRLAHAKALPLAAASLMLFAVAGCDRDSVKVYQASTNDTVVALSPAAAPMAMPATMPGGLPAPDTAAYPKLKFALPDGWKEKPAGQMRVASFEAAQAGKTADVSVIPLGGGAGGDAANVNRWRGQVGLEPLDDTALLKLAEQVEIAGQPAALFDVNGTSPGSGDPARILGVILHREDTAWFFKMTGDSALVENQKPAFVAFLKSVQFDETAATAIAPIDMSQLPPSHPVIPGMSSGGQPEAPGTNTP